MSGRWATEADAVAYDPQVMTLGEAAFSITCALTDPRHTANSKWWVMQASATIRNHRKSLGNSVRLDDLDDRYSSVSLLWVALGCVSEAAADIGIVDPAESLRLAEAALRTYWKRHGDAS
ncbi:MAG: hypothetical protein R2686_07025 [Candidatus Nanopelagicales bacterium]